MFEEATAALALTGATTVVAAMATDAWQSTRVGLLRLFHRDSETQQAAVDVQLETHTALLLRVDDPERVRRSLVPAWQVQMEDLLRRHPDMAEEVQAWVDRADETLPKAHQNWVQTVIARDNGTAVGAQGGDVHLHYARPGQSQPSPSEADGDLGDAL